jgi:hypothetical protein
MLSRDNIVSLRLDGVPADQLYNAYLIEYIMMIWQNWMNWMNSS